MEPVAMSQAPDLTTVNLSRYELPADFSVKPNKENCRDLYISIRQYLHSL